MTTKGDFIHSYSRRQALEDGALVDAYPMAAEVGYRVPVAFTSAAWERCVTVPDGVTGQDEAGRLWDVLSVLMFRIRLGGSATSELHFVLSVQDDARVETVELKAVCGPDDDGSPCLTIMLPDED